MKFLPATLLALSLAISVVNAQPHWTAHNGPRIPSFSVLAPLRDGSILGAETGVYKSTDDGTTWIKLSSQGRWQAIIEAPNGILFGAGDDKSNAGLYMSNDTGITWKHVSVEPSDFGVRVDQICCDSNGKIYCTHNHDVYLSSNGGTTWKFLKTDVYPNSLSILGKTRVVLLAGGYDFVSTDAGSSWIRMVGSVPSSRDIVMNSKGECIGTNYDSTVFSLDSGITWTRRSAVRDLSGWHMVCDRFDHLFVRKNFALFVSTDDGRTWIDRQKGFGTNTYWWPEISLTRSGKVIYSGNGVWTSSDGGSTFRQTAGSFFPLWFSDAMLRVLPDGEIQVGESVGLIFTIDGGTTWLDHWGSNAYNVRQFVGSGNQMYASGAIAQRFALYHSTDRGENFELVDTSHAVEGLTLDSNGTLWGASGKSFYKITDHGHTWTSEDQALKGDQPYEMATAPNDDLFVVGWNNGFFASRDNGENWSLIAPKDSIWNPHILGFTHDSKIYVTQFYPRKLLRSENGGASWIRSDDGLTDPSSYPFVERKDGVLFYATDQGLYMSPDHGDHWYLDTPLGSEFKRFFNIAFDLDGSLLAITDSGFFRATPHAPLRVTTTEKSHIGVYPNPVHDRLYIGHSHKIEAEAQIYDQLGRFRLNIAPSALEHGSIDVSALSSGVYYLDVRNSDGSIERNRLIKE